MAPWLRTGDTMVDIAEAIHMDYVPGTHEDPDCPSWRDSRKPRLNVLLRNGKEVYVLFDSEEAGRNTYEMLFRLLMPEVAQALEEAANGSRSGTQFGGEGLPADPYSATEVLEGDPLGVHDTSSLLPERFEFPSHPGGEAGHLDPW